MRIAFRLGVLVSEVSQNLEPIDYSQPPESWAYVVPDVTPMAVQKELDAIHAREVSISTCQVLIQTDDDNRALPALARCSLVRSARRLSQPVVLHRG